MSMPSIPDTIYKLLILLGIAAITYSFLKYNERIDQIFLYTDNIYKLNDTANIKEGNLDFQKKRLLYRSRILSDRIGIENPIKVSDSSVIFSQVLPNDKNNSLINDTIGKMYEDYENIWFDYKQTVRLGNFRIKANQVQVDYISKVLKNYQILGAFGILLFVLGFRGFWKFQRIQDDFLIRQLNEKPKVYSNCQSCGREYSAMIKFSSEKDGKFNYAFCKECYKDGNFINLTSNEIIDQIKKDFPSMSNRQYEKITKKIRRLDRWRNPTY
jgi:hypothetical protein